MIKILKHSLEFIVMGTIGCLLMDYPTYIIVSLLVVITLYFMKVNNMIKLLLFILLVVVITGCSGDSLANSISKNIQEYKALK